MQQQIENIITEKFNPTYFKAVNQSALHRGHAGDDNSGNSHWHITIVSDKFAGKNRLARHREVHQQLADIVVKIHAINLILRTPEEWKQG
jgi:BolA protein